MKPHLPLSLLKTLLATAAVAVTVTLCAVTYEPSASAHVPAGTSTAHGTSAHRLPNTVSFSSALQGTAQKAAQQAVITAEQTISRTFSYCSLSFDTPQASADAEISALTSVMPVTAEGSTPVSTVSAYPVGATAPSGVGGAGAGVGTGSGAGVALASAGNDISGTSVALASAETAAVTPLTVSENSAVIDPNSLETPFVHIYQDEYDELSDEAKKNYYWSRGWPAGQYNIYWFGYPFPILWEFDTPNDDYPRVFAGIRHSSRNSGLMAGGLIYIQGGASAHLVNASYSGGSVPPVYITLGNVTFTGETFSLTHNQCDAIYLGEGSVNISVSGSVTFSDNSCGIHYGGSSSTFTLCDSRVVTFSGNDTAIDFLGTTTLSNNGDVSFSGNGTAISAGTLTLSGNGDVSFSGNSGGAIIGSSYDGRTFTLSDNKSVTFSDNSGCGAIDIHSGTFTLRGNGNVSFRGNTASEGGGAISYSAPDTFTLSDNGNVTFSDNSVTSTSAYGGAISNRGTFRLSNNASVTFNGNSVSSYHSAGGGAIANSGTFTLRGYESVTFSGNSATATSLEARGGAIYNKDTFTLSGNGDVTFSGNSATSTSFDASGGAIFSVGTFTLSDNGDVTFSENSTSHADVFRGGAIYNCGTFTVSGNGDVSFSGNSGGAIRNGNSSIDDLRPFTLSDNKSVTFCRNSVSSGNYVISNGQYGVLTLSGNGYVTFSGNSGGVISNSKVADLTLSGNGDVTFSGNSTSSDYVIFNSEHSVLTLSGNGDVTFSGNSGGAIKNGTGNSVDSIRLSNNASVTFNGNSVSSTSSNACGGAIYNNRGGGSFTLSGNGDVTFSGNSATSTSSSFGGEGGAIYNSGTFTLSGNGDVTFSGNSVAAGTDSEVHGGAIYNAASYRSIIRTFTLSGNGDVLFEKNYENTNGIYRLRSIYSAGKLNLSASEGKSITFRDGVYASGTVNLNQDYTDDAGVVHRSTGDIILTGATTEADLREVKGGVDGTAEEILNSRTSEIDTMVTLYGGRLIVEDGAILNGQGITTAEGANATLRLNNGTLNESGYAVTIGTGSTLELDGRSTMTASALNLQDGATLAFCINGQEESLLNLNSTLRTGNSLNVTITPAEGMPVMSDTVTLLTLNNAAGYDTQNWTAEKVHVSGASFDDLSWANGVLTLRTGGSYWDVSRGETTTTLTIHGPSNIYQAETLAPWTNAERDFIIRGAADDAALAVTPVVQAHSLTAEGVALDLGSAAQQIGTLYIVDATVTSSHTNSSRGFVDGDVVIGTNGTLRLTKFDALGWGGSATDSITLEGGEGEEAVLELGARQTMATNITLNGYSRVTSTAQPTGSDNNAPSFDTFGGRISATGEHNTIEVALAQRSALTIDVAEGGALEISGDVRPSASGIGGGITKTGEGTLLFSGENKSLRNFRQTAGQTRFVGDVVFNGASGGSLSLSGGAQLDLQGNVVFDDSVQVLGNAQMVFTGDGETAVMQHQIKTTNVAAAAAMTVQGFRTFRATLEDESNTSLFSIYGSALFRDNAEVTVEDVNSTWWGTGFKVSGNLTLADNDALRFRNNSANGDGGAIENTGSVSLSNNGVVTFAGNRATSHGGAIDNWGGTCILENNQNVTFSDNRLTSTYGAAIYNSGTLTLRGNGDVLFEKNAEISDGIYRLRSIYSTGTLNLSAAEGKSILFRDSVYASGTANLNADGEGDIIFTGATTEADLQEVKGGVAGTATEIENSRSSILDATVTLYGGTLQVRDGASLTVKNLTSANGSALVLHDASFTTTGDSTLAAVTISGNTVLTAQTGATLTLQQALVNSGTLTVGGTLNVSDLTLTSTTAASTYIDVNGDSGDNGFLKDNTSYSVQVVNGGTVVSNNATVKHGNMVMTLNSDGTATADGMVDYGTYYINGGSASLAAIQAVASSAKVQMTGGCLTIDTNTATEILHDNTAALNITIRRSGSHMYAEYGEIAFEGISHTSHGGAMNLSGSLNLGNNGAVLFRNNSANGDGGAIENTGSVSLSNNGVVTFAGNRATSHGGAIDNWGGTCILEDNQNVTFSDNRLTSTYGAAIYNSGTLTLRGNGDVLFEKNAEISDGIYRLRSIYSTGTLNLSAAEGKSILFRDSVYASGTANLNADGEGDIIFTGATTEADLQEVKGGVAGTATEIENSRSSILNATVTLYGGTLQVRDGASLTVKNLTSANGSALVLHDASFTTTGDSTLAAVTVSGNSTLTAQTGALLTLQQALVNSGTLTIGGTLDVSALTLTSTTAASTYIDVNGDSGNNGFLKDNSIYSVQVVNGGTSVNNNATIKHGTLTLTLNSNGTATSGGTVDYGTYYINGGSADLSAIIAVSPMAAVEMDGGTLTIDADTATEIRHDNTASLLFTARQTGSKEFAQYRELVFADIISSSYGGAIYNSRSDTFTLSGNESVTFSGNSTSADSFYVYGGAIRNYGTFTLSGNGDVLFEKNAEISNGIYRLRSIYSSNGTLNLSASEGKSITFRDGVYAFGTVNLNQEGSGDIILTGATTEADLREVKGGIDGTAAEILNSRTSEFDTMATLYGGRLIVEDGAILNGQGITTAEGANATLRLNNGTLNEGGYAVTIGTGSTLELAGSNTMTASALDLQDGATLSFYLGEQAGSLLSLNGTLQTGNALNVTITPAEGMSVMSDTVTLLTLNNAAGYDTQNWTAEKVHISGASFDDLSWANGVLTLRTGGSDWDVSRGETTTTLTIHGPSSINQAETLAQWTNTERDFIIRGAADDAALAVAPVVQAHSLTAEGVELDLGSAAQQIGTLYIVDATVTSSHTNSSRGFVDGDVVIGTNGTLRLTKFDALGWGGSATDSITLEGSEGEEAVLELGARQTMGTNLALNGYSRVTSTAQPTGSGNNAPSFDTYGGRISATGEHNTIEVALAQRSALTIDVAEGGALEISGDVRPSASGIGGGITKTGEGTLLFSGENKSLRNFSQTAGQTRFVSNVQFTGASGGSLSLSGGAQLDLQGNVVFSDRVQVLGNAQMVFTGDGETAVMQHQIKTTNVAAAAAMTVQGFRTFRTTLADASNTTLFSIYGSVLFRDNAEVTVEDVNSTGWGTGFNVGGNLTFADNGALLFRNLRADVGGAFMVNTNGQVTLTGNEQVEFSDNTIGSHGGAFRVNDGAAMEMAGNAHLLFTDNSAGMFGGAISTSGTLSMTGSEELRFTGNSAHDGGAISNNSKQAVLRIADNGSVRFEANTANSTGGALHVGAGNVYLQRNEEVVFSGNKAASSSGGAVYNAGTFTVSDNGDVLFEKNAEVSGGTYRLRSIYSTGTLNLSAAEGKSITFRDGVYASGAVALNQAGTGDIILTGATTEADLREVKGGTDGTEAEIQNSRTSEFATMATLYGGRLIVEDGAILNGQGITTAEGANATLRLNNGTLNESGYAVTIGAGSTLELDGRSTMTASALNLQDGATLAFCINGQEESLLNLNGTLQTGNTLKLSVTRGEKETGTRDCSILLRLNNAANYNTQNWTAEKVQVSGASFSDLIWAGSLLLLREEAPEWDVSIGETATTLTIHGPSYIGFGATMAPWTNDSRDFIIRSAAEDASLTFSPAVTARSLTTEGVNLDFDAKMQNIGSLIIRDAVVTSAYTNNARGFVNGEVIIGTDGTLRLTKLDAIGWNTTATPRITMEGESGHEAVLELGARQTMTTQLVLNGNSVVRSTESPTGSGNNAPCFDSFGGTITATGENNRIEVGLTQRQNMTVTVEAEGELEMSGGIVTSSNGNGGSFAKEGAGALRFTAQEALAISNFIQNAGTTEFSGAQTTVNGYTQNGGTLQVEGQTTLRGQTSVNGGCISIGEGESAALHLRNTTLNMAQGSELQAGGIIRMTADATGALALSGDVTLSSDGLSGQDGTYAVLSHADVQVLGDAAISNVRLENTLMDLAEACSVNLSHVMLAATARLTDEPATAHLDDVTAELAVGVNTTVTGHSTLRAGSTLVQNGQEALTLTPPAHSSVTQLESASFDSLTLTGTSLVLELRGYEPEMHNYATFIALSFTSGTDYASFDAALPVLMSTDGEHYAQAYHLQNGNGTTLFFESRAAGIIPEPATATLSLLALAALAARRRRRG